MIASSLTRTPDIMRILETEGGGERGEGKGGGNSKTKEKKQNSRQVLRSNRKWGQEKV